MLRRVGDSPEVAVDVAAVAGPTGVSDGEGVAVTALELTPAGTKASVRFEQPDTVKTPAKTTAAT
jgi:hypothetical protein